MKADGVLSEVARAAAPGSRIAREPAAMPQGEQYEDRTGILAARWGNGLSAHGVVARASSAHPFRLARPWNGRRAGRKRRAGAYSGTSDAPTQPCAEASDIDQRDAGDAEKIFTQVAAQHGTMPTERSIGRLCGRQLGQSKPSRTRADLRSSFPKTAGRGLRRPGSGDSRPDRQARVHHPAASDDVKPGLTPCCARRATAWRRFKTF